MTSHLKISGTQEQMNSLFENARNLSVRIFNKIGHNRWQITLRHSEYFPDEVLLIQGAKTIKQLIEIDNSRS